MPIKLRDGEPPDAGAEAPAEQREEIEDIGGGGTYRTLDEQEGRLSPAEAERRVIAQSASTSSLSASRPAPR